MKDILLYIPCWQRLILEEVLCILLRGARRPYNNEVEWMGGLFEDLGWWLFVNNCSHRRFVFNVHTPTPSALRLRPTRGKRHENNITESLIMGGYCFGGEIPSYFNLRRRIGGYLDKPSFPQPVIVTLLRRGLLRPLKFSLCWLPTRQITAQITKTLVRITMHIPSNQKNDQCQTFLTGAL